MRTSTSELLTAVDLAGLAEQFGIVGACLGVSIAGRRNSVAAGVIRASADDPVDIDTQFMVGSVTKALVGAVVMTAVCEGRLDLDRSVAATFELPIDSRITARHLLAHSSGLPDAWTMPPNDGSAEPTLAEYVDRLDTALHSPPGTRFGYSNAGYSVLGRVLELLDGELFADVMGRRLIEPLGLRAVFGQPTENTATGHVRLDDGTSEPVEVSTGSLAMAPAGSQLWATVDDLLRFGEAVLASAPSPLGDVGTDAVLAMRSPQLDIPDHRHGRRMGLGLLLDDRWGTTALLHDGGALGQSAYLRCLPELDLVVALTCTGGVPQVFHRRVFDVLFELFAVVPIDGIAGVAPPADVTLDPNLVIETDRYRGRFCSPLTDVVIGGEDGRLTISFDQGDGEPSQIFVLEAVERTMFVAQVGGRPYSVVFEFDSRGRAEHLLAGLRVLVRDPSTPTTGSSMNEGTEQARA